MANARVRKWLEARYEREINGDTNIDIFTHRTKRGCITLSRGLSVASAGLGFDVQVDHWNKTWSALAWLGPFYLGLHTEAFSG